MQVESGKRLSLPPRWFIRSFWHGHRARLGVSGGRVGVDGPRLVTGRAAEGESGRASGPAGKRSTRTWTYAALRPTETAGVVLEPRSKTDEPSIAS